MEFHMYVVILFLMIVISETKSKLDYRTKLELARKHYQRVAPEISCAIPKPKIFRPETATSRQFVPSATILHRCGENAGCCSIATHKCVAKSKEKVKLYFLVKSLPGLAAKRKKNRIKKFVFFNHTECYCRDMSYKPR